MAINQLPDLNIEDLGIEKDRESVRAVLAYSLIGLIVAVIVTTVAASLLMVDSRDNIRILTETILPTTVGLGGAVIGFYFGAKS